MPQLPPVAAAAFVFCLLAVIVVTTTVVQVRSRRRRMRLAMMVRETAPIPRPATSSADSADLKPSLRGQNYQRAQREGHFEVFDDRSATREAAPGRPSRRLTAQRAHALAASAPVVPESLQAIEVGAEAPAPQVAIVSDLPAAVADIEVAEEVVTQVVPEVPALHVTGIADVPVDVSDVEVPEEVVPEVEVPRAAPSAPVAFSPTHRGLVDLVVDLERSVPKPSLPDESPDSAESETIVVEAPEWELLPAVSVMAEASEAPSEIASEPPRETVREPRVTVLASRAPVPVLPAFMTREVTLGDAARMFRSSLTMTDGRQLRRAVAVGAATSVVAAAFAIRGRRR